MENALYALLFFGVLAGFAVRKAARKIKESETASRIAKGAAEGLLAKFLK